MPATPNDTTPITDWPLWWFSELEAAVERGDHALARECQLQLERLGVRVYYGRPRRKRIKEAAGEGVCNGR
jgi:hypothetical protein